MSPRALKAIQCNTGSNGDTDGACYVPLDHTEVPREQWYAPFYTTSLKDERHVIGMLRYSRVILSPKMELLKDVSPHWTMESFQQINNTV